MDKFKSEVTGLLLLLISWIFLLGISSYIIFIAEWLGKYMAWGLGIISVTIGLYLMYLSDKIRDKHRRD